MRHKSNAEKEADRLQKEQEQKRMRANLLANIKVHEDFQAKVKALYPGELGEWMYATGERVIADMRKGLDR